MEHWSGARAPALARGPHELGSPSPPAPACTPGIVGAIPPAAKEPACTAQRHGGSSGACRQAPADYPLLQPVWPARAAQLSGGRSAVAPRLLFLQSHSLHEPSQRGGWRGGVADRECVWPAITCPGVLRRRAPAGLACPACFVAPTPTSQTPRLGALWSMRARSCCAGGASSRPWASGRCRRGTWSCPKARPVRVLARLGFRDACVHVRGVPCCVSACRCMGRSI